MGCCTRFSSSVIIEHPINESANSQTEENASIDNKQCIALTQYQEKHATKKTPEINLCHLKWAAVRVLILKQSLWKNYKRQM